MAVTLADVLVLAAVLLVVGTVLQVGGVAFVALDVRDARRRLERYTHGDAVVEPLTAVAYGSVSTPKATADPPPPIENRVAALEDALHSLRTQMDDLAPRLLREAQHGAEDAAARVRRAARRESEALATLVLGMDDESARRRRVWSVRLIIGGLAVSLAGSFVWLAA